MDKLKKILTGDSLATLRTLESESVDCCVTSPPYWGLRDYGVEGQLGLEKTPEEFVQKMVEVFREVKRVLKNEGTLWLNLGDSYAAGGKNRTPAQAAANSTLSDSLETQAQSLVQQSKVVGGLKPKDMAGIPWRVAFALQADGWYLRQDIIWHKPNPMPESIRDRCTKAHEYIFLLAKSEKYFFDVAAIKEPAIYKNVAKMPPAGWGVGDEPRTSVGKSQAKFHRKSQPKGSFQGKHGEKAFRATGDFRNKRSVWTVAPAPFKDTHFATFPPKLIEPCIMAGSPVRGVVLDPFFGAGTTGLVAQQNNRGYLGIELNPAYVEIAKKRIEGDLFA